MTQQALYRKWRSRSFDELIGQPHVVRTLNNALRSDRVAHAYIFSGPRGTGKTSSARILAKTINCTAPPEMRPCDDCTMCRGITDGSSLDLIEIDAASNTQVDKVREAIVEKVNFVPSQARMKVYIIDEVHMLSNSAFNALLKTIEEPPPHAMFILATTELHKVPETILSRCQRLDFRRIPLTEIADHLSWVLEREGIRAEPELLALIARQATGSMRDALSLLDQLLAHGGDELSVEDARAALGLASLEAVQQLVAYLLAQQMTEALGLINELLDQGTDPRQFLSDLLDHLRALLLTLTGNSQQLLDLPKDVLRQLQAQRSLIEPYALIEIIHLFTQAGAELKLALQPQLPLELAIVESVLVLQRAGAAQSPVRTSPPPAEEHASMPPMGAQPARTRSPEPASLVEPPPPPRQVREAGLSQMTAPPTTTEPPAPTAPPARTGQSLAWWQAQWEPLLERVRAQGAVGQRAALRLKFGTPHAAEGSTLTVGFPNSIHVDLLKRPPEFPTVLQALQEMADGPVELVLAHVSRESRPVAARTKFESAADDPVVQEAMRHGGRIIEVFQE